MVIYNFLFIIVTSICVSIECDSKFDVTIESVTAGEVRRFWDSTGFSPPGPGDAAFHFLTSDDVTKNLALIGSLPFNAITRVRIHWLLDLIRVTRTPLSAHSLSNDTVEEEEEEKVESYDFQYLDGLLDSLVKYGLKPGFELMGNPGRLFDNLNDVENATVIEMWGRLVTEIGARYIDRYGVDEVNGWRFETWNEPDLRQYNILNFTLTGYLRYFEESRSALSRVCDRRHHCQLKLSGPAGLFKTNKKNHKLCWGLLNHCATNDNTPYKLHGAVTDKKKKKKKRDCELDFVSFHKKGAGSPKSVVDQSHQFYALVKREYFHNQTVLPPLLNDEADILSGWWRSEKWRSDVRYAAAVCQVVILMYNSGPHVIHISNDNAFINTDLDKEHFMQRTLITRFVIEKGTEGEHSQMFQKPVYAAVGLLAYLYHLNLNVSYHGKDDRLNIIATTNGGGQGHFGWCCSVVVVFSSVSDASAADETTNLIHLRIHLPEKAAVQGKKFKLVEYRLDNLLPHPASIWEANGSPNNPGPLLRSLMRKAQGAHRVRFTDLSLDSPSLNITTAVTVPTVTLIHICQYTDIHPNNTVMGLTALNVTYNEVLLLWKDTHLNSKCIKTYEVEFMRCADRYKRKFIRINCYDLIFPNFHFASHTALQTGGGNQCKSSDDVVNVWRPGEKQEVEEEEEEEEEEMTRGLYRVRVVDYWGRASPYSPLLHYGC